jgi:hypothetical protein
MLWAAAARADVTIGQDWNPVSNENGFTYFDGFTDYADGSMNTNLSQVSRSGNNWLRYDNTAGQYWGQLVGQMWANSALAPANFNLNPRLEFDLDATESNWGRLMIRIDYGNGGGNAGNQSGSTTVDFSHLVARNKATLSAAPNPFVQHISIDLSSFLPRDETSTFADLAVFIQPNFWGYWDPDIQQFISANYTTQTYYIDNLRITADPVKTNAAWNVDADGNWRTGQTSQGTATWAGGIPNGAGHTANFFAVTNYDSGQNDIGARTVDVDAPLTIGVMNFNNANGYTISGVGPLTVQGANGVAAAINTANGNHTIATPLVLAGDTTVNNLTGGGLTVTNLQPTSGAITKNGPGSFTANVIRAGALTVNAGTASIIANGSNAGTSRVGALTIAGGTTPTATLDLNDNDLIATAGNKATITAQIRSARNNGAWNGQGITSSAARTQANHATTIGVLSGAEFKSMNGGASATFDGFTVADSDVLAKYTWYGDTDFNGRVNFDDYVRTDNGFNNHLTGWMNGDYDGNNAVNFDDYVLIDLAFNTQSGTLGRALSFVDGSDRSGSGISDSSLQRVMQHLNQFGDDYARGFLAAVPEPASIALSGIATSVAMLRRRRREK